VAFPAPLRWCCDKPRASRHRPQSCPLALLGVVRCCQVWLECLGSSFRACPTGREGADPSHSAHPPALRCLGCWSSAHSHWTALAKTRPPSAHGYLGKFDQQLGPRGRREGDRKAQRKVLLQTNTTPNSTPEPHQSYINFHELALLLPLFLLNCTIRLLDSRVVSLVARASLRCLIRRCNTSVGLATNKLVVARQLFVTQLGPALGLVQRRSSGAA
jgi:hypothetical protein